MNKGVILMAVLAFTIPIGLILAMNADKLSGGDSDSKKPSGKLIYFYSPS